MTKVTLRLRPSRDGQLSYYYLDFYPPVFNPVTRATRRHEYLNKSIYNNPTTQEEIDHNETSRRGAEAIRCKREYEIFNMEYNVFDERVLRESFLEYFDNKSRKKHSKWNASYQQFLKFMNGGPCTFGDISIELCNGFMDFLEHEAIHHINGNPLGINSASAYFGIFKCCLKEAFKENRLKFNPNDYLEKIQTKPTKRPYLTMDEVIMLKNTPCKYDVLKRASIFAILTGLRKSDIITLRWEHITTAPDGGPCIIKTIVKGRREEVIYISEEALSYCGERYEIGPIFPELKVSMTNGPLKSWLKQAGIDKNFSFHCFRHTFATLQIASGVDVYTVSHQLTHRFVSTTQIYAELVDKKLRESANALTLIEDK